MPTVRHFVPVMLLAIALPASLTGPIVAAADPFFPKWQVHGITAQPYGHFHLDGGGIDEDTEQYETRIEVPRARFGLEGDLGTNFYYNAQLDFSGDWEMQDLLVGYRGPHDIALQIGQMKEPTSLEFLTSSKDTTFIRRGSLDRLIPRFNTGVQVSIPYAYGGVTVGGYGTNLRAFHPDEDQHSLTARATYAPVNIDRQLVHLGAAYSHRWVNDETNTVRQGTTPETTITRDVALDTGPITGADKQRLYGLEAAYENGPFSLQGQYLTTTVRRDVANITVQGYYVKIAYRLTGEHRPYNQAEGIFERLRPFEGVHKGGIGAWEIAARHSYLDLNDDDINGGILGATTLGLNWYWNTNIELQANMTFAEAETPARGDDPVVYTLRAQLIY